MSLFITHSPLIKFTTLKLSAIALIVAGIGIASAIVLTANTNQAEAATKCVTKVFKQGSRNTCVKYMQQMVNASGVAGKVSADGVFGAGTKKAVVKFQKAKNLSADGAVGSGTWTALCKVSGASSAKKGAGCESSKSGWTYLGTYSASVKDNKTPQVTGKYYACKVAKDGQYTVKAKAVITYLSSSSPFIGGTVAALSDMEDSAQSVKIKKVGTTATDVAGRMYSSGDTVAPGISVSSKADKGHYNVPYGAPTHKTIKVSSLTNC